MSLNGIVVSVHASKANELRFTLVKFVVIHLRRRRVILQFNSKRPSKFYFELEFICTNNQVNVALRSKIHSRKHKAMRSSLFWDVMKLRLVLCYRRFGITFRSIEDGTGMLFRNFDYQLQIYVA